MKRELERTLEDRCVARIEALGGLALKLSIPGVRGFPDHEGNPTGGTRTADRIPNHCGVGTARIFSKAVAADRRATQSHPVRGSAMVIKASTAKSITWLWAFISAMADVCAFRIA